MKKIVLLIGLLGTIWNLVGQTEVVGNQSGTWTAAYSPYQVVGDIVVPSGQSLTIRPGVEVNFQGNYKMTINGKMKAKGSLTDTIYFTTDHPDVGWGGIDVTSGDLCELSYCRLEYGKAGVDYPDNVGGALALFNSNAHVFNCVFADNQAPQLESGLAGAVYGVNLGASDTTKFVNCTFLRNSAYGEGGAIKLSSDLYTEITGCEFIDNHVKYGGGAVAFYSTLDSKITRCLFVNNYSTYSNGGAIVALGLGNSITFANCTIAHNTASGGAGGGLNLSYTTAHFVNTIIYENPGLYGDDLYLSQNGEADVNYSNLTMPDVATGAQNIEADPLFVDADNGDYHLQPTSPCINSGNDIGLPFVGTAPDMGYYEYGLVPVFELAQKEKITLSPNPAHDFVTIESSQLCDNVQVLNIWGQIVMSQDLSTKKVELDLAHLGSGIYFARLFHNQKIITTQKLILE